MAAVIRIAPPSPGPASRAAGLCWLTDARPRAERLACLWLIARFIDPGAEFRFLPAGAVLAEARRAHAIAFDVPGAALCGNGERSCFDALLAATAIDDPALDLLAAIVRGAFSARGGHAPQSAGLLAVAYGLARRAMSARELQRQGFALYDALYAWCRKAPPGPDLAPHRGKGGWRARRRTGRILAALHAATLHEISLERAP